MRFDYVASDGEAQTGAAAATDSGPVHLVETFEDADPVGRRHADAWVADPDQNLAFSLPDTHDDLAAFGAELDGVVEQVDQDLAESVLVAAHRRDSVRQVQDDLEPLPLGKEFEPLRVGPGHADQIDIVQKQLHSSALDAGQIEQLVDHLREMTRLDLDLGDSITQAGRGGFSLPRGGLGEQADSGQRRSQLV